MAACPVCGKGKSKRHCPALGQVICPTCCGTKRLVEIRCPADCGWLKAARAHPPAVQQRQQEHDANLVVPLIRGLDDGGYAVLMACLPAAVAFRNEADPPPLDSDLQAAAAALAATAETAIRGVLYEHQPDTLPRLDASTAAAMRRVEDAVKDFRRQGHPAPDAYLAFLGRVLKPRLADASTGLDLASEIQAGFADLQNSK